MSDTLNNLSPLDGRYREKTKNTRANFSESALIKARLISEIHWLDYFLTNFKSELKDPITGKKIHDLSETIPDSLILKVKDIEKTTNHDVKAVELALVDEFNHSEEVQSLIHIFLTSEDINSLSYALMLKKSHTDILAWVHDIILALEALASDTKGIAMSFNA